MAVDSPNKGSWYQTWWGVVLLGTLAVFILAVICFGSLVGVYWWKIKSGQGQQLITDINKLTAVDPAEKINPLRKDLETADDPYLGNPQAQLVIVEFVDFKCPNSRAADPIIKKLTQKYWEKVKVIVRDFPAESIHQGASELAMLAACANEQGRYWAFEDIFFQNQEQLTEVLSEERVKGITEQVGGNFQKLKTCLANTKVRTEVNKDYADGYKYGVKGTPTFFVNGSRIEGVISWEAWEKFMQNF